MYKINKAVARRIKQTDSDVVVELKERLWLYIDSLLECMIHNE